MTKVTREHLAGLELALSLLGLRMGYFTRCDLEQLIAQASAAPEQEAVAWIEPVALDSAGPVYDAGFKDGCAEAKRLNAHPSAEIERLRAEIERWKSRAQVNWNEFADSQRVDVEQKLADAQALLRESAVVMAFVGMQDHLVNYDKSWDVRVKVDAFLSATAQPAVIVLSAAEVQSGLDRVRWAEGLILELPEDHEGRNSWLLNYGTAQPAEVPGHE